MSNIDKVVLEDIKDILVEWRQNIEENILLDKNFLLTGETIEISGKIGEDPIEFHLTDLLPENKKERKECLKLLIEWAEAEIEEMQENA